MPVEVKEACGRNRDKINIVSQLASKSTEQSGQHYSSMDETLDIMDEVGKKVSVINDIAYQTHLLSINAAIEARSAGDAGRGFAVVAHEVRVLAEKAAAAATDINQIVGKNSAHSSKTKQQFEELTDLVGQNALLLDDLSTTSDVLSDKANTILTFLEDIAEHGVTNTEQSFELSRIAKSIYHHSCELKQSSDHFKAFNFLDIIDLK